METPPEPQETKRAMFVSLPVCQSAVEKRKTKFFDSAEWAMGKQVENGGTPYEAIEKRKENTEQGDSPLSG